MKELTQIDTFASVYAASRQRLAANLNALSDAIEKLKREHLPRIKASAAVAREAEQTLHDAIQAAPQLFEKPRTITLHGIKLGFQKGKGVMAWANDDRVCAAIRKCFPEEADALIKVTETPVKAALSQKSAADLKRIGITVTDTGDQVIIKPADSDVDKLVAMYLADKT